MVIRDDATCVTICVIVICLLVVKEVKGVVNFDMPNNIEDYVHRIGRTGRAGATGVSVSFITEKHSKMARELVDILQGANQVVPPQLTQMMSMGGGGHHGGSSGFGGGSRGGRRF